ncbi:Protein of unknown function [Georgenia satyanarayanai]|uniref:DUF1648 domain-containing protein n=1 Tax=Georgenia satyanarayanai TaxID=860221 RepID=A0A2Y9AQ13_9MICO|nr:DUF1648 domain-containing protein [Georgenia satyanarayanai]PYF96742.1 uncharacterized protein DUF1648 [Georgenia satyanarayanai]SSA46484.1 Protein of unknown function [Georgenia satyanarayanai]
MTQPLPHRRRAWVLGVLVPALITAASWLAVVRLLPRLPDPVAVHWGPSGVVDRTGTVAELVAPMAVISGLSLLVMAAFSVLTGRQAITRRLTLGLAVGLATLFAGMTLVSVTSQVDAATAADAASPDGWLAVSILAAVALGAVAGALAGSDPALPATGTAADGAPTADLPEGHRAVWVRGVAGLGTTVTWVVVAAGTAASAALWLLADTALPLVVTLPLLALLLTMTTWQVQVDARGLTARGTFGWPRVHVPAGEVERADVTTVRPFAEFGGWGLRTSVGGKVGVVIRTGEAIAVERSGGRHLVITVDDAASGAALLNTYAARARTAPARDATSD